MFYNKYKFIVYYLYQQMHTYIKILNYITNAPVCFGASAFLQGSLMLRLLKLSNIKIIKIT